MNLKSTGKPRKLHPADIAEILQKLDPDRKHAFFQSLDPNIEAQVLKELDLLDEIELLKRLDHYTISQLLDALPVDDAADILADVDPDRREKILHLMRESASRTVKELLEYDEDTAGGKMNTSVFTVLAENTCAEAIEKVKHLTEDIPLHYIYVVKNGKQLEGVFSLETVIRAGSEQRIREIMETDVIAVPPEMDQEEVARVVSKYDLLSVPVVDAANHLLGIVTVDDVIDVIREEQTEDIYKLVGTDDRELMNQSSLKIARIRLPWLLATLLGGMISCMLMKSQGAALEFVKLSFFVPIMMGMSGNIGSQSSTLVVCGLATGRIDIGLVGQVFMKELRVVSVMGIICAVTVSILALFFGVSIIMMLVVCIAMFLAIIVAGSIGCLLPLFLKQLKIDPAVASGPFVTTCNDITSLAIYFSLAHFLLSVFR